MKIALVGYEANIKNRVGSNQYAFELLRALHELDQKNEYVVFLPSPPRADMPVKRKGWQYRVVGPHRLWNFFSLPRALFAERKKFDLVFNPGHYAPFFSFSPLVTSVMDLGFLRFPEQFTGPILAKLKYWTGFSARKAAHVLAISEQTKDDLVKFYGLRREKVTVTYPGYDRKMFHPKIKNNQKLKVRKKYELSRDYLLYLGTLKPSKNLDGLLEAFAIISRSDRQKGQLKLVIAGRKGWLYQKIFRKVNELGLAQKVIFTGFVESDDVPGLMAGARAFVLPSFWEGFGIPVLEAMACGTPVVSAGVGSLPEVVGDAGLLVDPHDPQDLAQKMAKVLYNKEAAKQCRQRGLARAKDFSWEKCARQTLSVLEKVGKN